MSKPNVPKFVCCIHVSVPNTTTYSAIMPTSTSTGASGAGPAPDVTAGPVVSPGVGSGASSGGADDAARGLARARRNDCASARERMSTAGVYGQHQGQ